MKITLLYALIIALVSLKSYGQSNQSTLKLTYTQEVHANKNKTDSPEYAKTFVKKIMKEVESRVYRLDIEGDKASFYKQNDGMTIGDNVYKKMAKKLSAFSDYVYTDLENEEQLLKENVVGKLFIIKEQPYQYDWKLLDSTKTLKGYSVRKASTSAFNKDNEPVKVVAWYCPDIAFQFGPSEFGGLPGLILNLRMGNTEVTVDEIDFNPEKIKISEPKKGERISKKELKKYKKRILEVNGVD